MVKVVEWSTNWIGDDQIKGKYIVFFNRLSIARGQWEGLMFDLQGFGKSKSEKILGLKRNLNHITLYFLKWYISYDKQGYKESLRNVNIINERVVF